MMALSIKQPFAWAVCHAGMRIVNRDWPVTTIYRGPILIHASFKCARDDYTGAWYWMRIKGLIRGSYNPNAPECPLFEELPLGALVARAELVDVILPGGDCDSPWYTGGFGIVLANVVPLAEPIPWQGSPRLFGVPDSAFAEAAT